MKQQRSCAQWQRALRGLWSNEVLSSEEQAALESHLAECEDCAAMWQRERAIIADLRARSAVTPLPDHLAQLIRLREDAARVPSPISRAGKQRGYGPTDHKALSGLNWGSVLTMFRSVRVGLFIPLVLRGLVSLSLLALAIGWISSSGGPWSRIFAVAFTLVGGALALFPLLPKRIPMANRLSVTYSRSVKFEGVILGAGKRQGALVVYVSRKRHGSSIYLYHGFQHDDLRPGLASKVVELKSNGNAVYAALFSALQPGNYTVSVEPAIKADVTIHANQVTEVDWDPGRAYTTRKAEMAKKQSSRS